ncbi:MAG TPA: hypothetical protein VIJ18_00990 [Microbacteriaceae bacterium]
MRNALSPGRARTLRTTCRGENADENARENADENAGENARANADENAGENARANATNATSSAASLSSVMGRPLPLRAAGADSCRMAAPVSAVVRAVTALRVSPVPAAIRLRELGPLSTR